MGIRGMVLPFQIFRAPDTSPRLEAIFQYRWMAEFEDAHCARKIAIYVYYSQNTPKAAVGAYGFAIEKSLFQYSCTYSSNGTIIEVHCKLH